MTQKTYPLPLTFEQILNLVLQLPAQEQEQIIQQIKKNSPKNREEDLLTVFDRIGKNAQAKGLTEEILERSIFTGVEKICESITECSANN